MERPWYIYVIIGVVAGGLLWLCDKYKIMTKYKVTRWRLVRYFIVFFIASIICWGVYDLLV